MIPLRKVLFGIEGGKTRAIVTVTVTRTACRKFCSEASVDRESPPRSKEFYEENAIQRNYFYFMDNRGQLFLEETKRRNIATCMKDKKFLDFTIRNMKPNDTCKFLDMDSISLCGKEINYIAHADRLSPFTFRDKLSAVGNSGDTVLCYAGTLTQPYRPELLAFHPETGRIYHQITNHKHYKGKFGLLHPHLCLELGESITYDDDAACYVFKDSNGVCHSLEVFT